MLLFFFFFSLFSRPTIIGQRKSEFGPNLCCGLCTVRERSSGFTVIPPPLKRLWDEWHCNSNCTVVESVDKRRTGKPDYCAVVTPDSWRNTLTLGNWRIKSPESNRTSRLRVLRAYEQRRFVAFGCCHRDESLDNPGHCPLRTRSHGCCSTYSRPSLSTC